MRIRNLVSATALLAAATPSAASPDTIDPSNDLDCATIFKFYHLAAEGRHAPADEIELTRVMNAWFTTKWDSEHPSGGKAEIDHYLEVVRALGEDPNGHRETIRTCANRATSDPAFEPFWILHRKASPAAH